MRRRNDRPARAELERYLGLPPWLREPIPVEEFGSLLGASDADLQAVSDFLAGGGLSIVNGSAARRTVVALGSASRVRKLFSADLAEFTLDEQRYISYSGGLSVPDELSETIMCVFGRDTRLQLGRNQAPYPFPEAPNNTVQQMADYYDFPPGKASGQLIVIMSAGGGFNADDLTAYFKGTGLNAPDPVTWPGTDSGAADTETTQDICIAATVAPEADFAVCYTDGTPSGWDTALSLLTPDPTQEPGARVPDVVSISYPIYHLDDQGLMISPPAMELNSHSSRFADLAAHHVTVCVASGDSGVSAPMGKPQTGKQQVQYPASDPLVLACGGTAVCIDPSNGALHEYVWNDSVPEAGATGGGVSSYFGCPVWQQTGDGLPPVSKLDGQSRRGIPDVAANGAFGTGYNMYLNVDLYGQNSPLAQFPGNGTSAAAPLYAGLFAVLNGLFGVRLGFVTQLLYMLAADNADVFNPVPDPAFPGGPQDNGFNNIQGYPVQPGWDACTGLGTINGTNLYNVLLEQSKATHDLLLPWRPRL
jgi:kumamolisin